MKRCMVLLLSLCLILTGCADEVVIKVTKEPKLQKEEVAPPAKQVLMLYMVASDLESKAGLASQDIEEMIDSEFLSENMTVLLCAGGTTYWWTDGISRDDLQVYEIRDGEAVPVYTMENENMAQPETLTEFLDYGYSTCDGQYYELILWDHGGGAVLGFGADENYEYDALSLREMDQALENTQLIRDGKRFEWVGFDACLMGMIEVADMLSDYAGYMVASEEIEAGTGWDYRCLADISKLPVPTGDRCAGMIVDAYQKHYESHKRSVKDYTLSVLDLSRTDEVIQELDELAKAANETMAQGGYSKIARSRNKSKTFGKVSNESVYDTVDLYDLSERLMSLYPEEAEDLQNALGRLVIRNATNVHGAHGVAVYFPYENKAKVQNWLEVYETTGFSGEYRKFLDSFTQTLSAAPLAQWDISEEIPVENEEQGLYYVQLTPEQCENYAKARFSVWEEDTPGNYICWLISDDVTLQEDGKLTSTFRGKRFYLGDTSGEELPCLAMEIERNEAYVKYAIPAFVIPKGGDLMDMELFYLHVRVDDAHPEGQILGAYNQKEADSTQFPDRDVLEIGDGDCVIPFLYGREIVFREDGTLAPFDAWKATSGSGATFDVSGELKVSIREAQEDVSYCCLFSITDTQSNLYFTNSVNT